MNANEKDNYLNSGFTSQRSLQEPNLVIVLGAKVHDDGTPSGSLQRRIDCALIAAKKLPNPRFLVTGGSSRPGVPAEAEVMRRAIIESGYTENTVFTDPHSLDTLESVENCATIIKKSGPFASVTICSDRYHLRRIITLFNMLGISTQAAPIVSGMDAMGVFTWVYYWIRDIVALVYDVAVLWIKGLKNG